MRKNVSLIMSVMAFCTVSAESYMYLKSNVDTKYKFKVDDIIRVDVMKDSVQQKSLLIQKSDSSTYPYSINTISQVYYPGEESIDSSTIDGYEYVDLGLQSGLKWATYNVGAMKPTEYGDYFSWGETRPKDHYFWDNYKWCRDLEHDDENNPTDFIKYCSDSLYGLYDNKRTLEEADDAASANWGISWRMPKDVEYNELMVYCKWDWTADYQGSGVAGWIGTSRMNGKTIFFPAAGGYINTCNNNNIVSNDGFKGYYWTASRGMNNKTIKSSCYLIGEDIKKHCLTSQKRWLGNQVRAVSGDRTYSISFYDLDSTFNKTLEVKLGEAAEYVNPRIYIGREFVRWSDSSFVDVSGDMDVYAIYDPLDKITEEVTVSGQLTGYDYVDLGLASGLKWATYNVGATSVTEKGDLYAWGETEPKDHCTWEDYKWSDGKYNTMNKYCEDERYGKVDSLYQLEVEDDAAMSKWGDSWRMPTSLEQRELLAGCYWYEVNDFMGSGIHGYIGKSKTNGNQIFLPANLDVYSKEGAYAYQSSTLSFVSYECLAMFFEEAIYADVSKFSRQNVLYVRAVAAVEPTPSDTVSIVEPTNTDSVAVSGQVEGYDYVDLGLESGLKWATYNVGASKVSEYGDFYAWGETQSKEVYDWSTYKWANGSYKSITKYCTNSSYGTVDDKSKLDPDDDVATVYWGSKWRMPTIDEIKELIAGCEWNYVENFNNSGLNGYIGVSNKNQHTIFFPLVDLSNGKVNFENGNYRSSSLGSRSNNSGAFYMSKYGIGVEDINRTRAAVVRAVAE